MQSLGEFLARAHITQVKFRAERDAFKFHALGLRLAEPVKRFGVLRADHFFIRVVPSQLPASDLADFARLIPRDYCCGTLRQRACADS